MPTLSLLRPSSIPSLAPLALAASALLAAPLARADFSRAPESPYDHHARTGPASRTMVAEPSEPWPSADAASALRFHVGPALLFEPQGPGLFTAIDVGRRAVGARVCAAWLRAESARGFSAYDLELWIDFRHRARIHPIVGAGASLLRGAVLDSEESIGAAALRGAIEYELPVEGAEARLALSLVAYVPAIGTGRTMPWGLAALTLGAGF